VILVTVGNHNRPFFRLLKKIDQLARDETIKTVFAQIGCCEYEPEYYKYKRFVGFNTFLRLIEKSRFVITHAGAGTIMNILSAGKPAVVVPRLSRYGEHTNDHQLGITKALEKQGKIIPVYDIEKLDEAVIRAKTFKVEIQRDSTKIIDLIQEHIKMWN
jgi:beta-1,4-N-acetylglucosaminyltransferase